MKVNQRKTGVGCVKKWPTQNGRRRWIIRQWMTNPICHWCRKPTVLILRTKTHADGRDRVPFHDDEATLDHVYSKLHPKRLDPPGDERRWVLACYRCNCGRNDSEQRELAASELHARSGRYPSSPTPESPP